jgi:hypothetical protein
MDFLYGKFHAMPRIVTAWQRVSSPCFLRELVDRAGVRGVRLNLASHGFRDTQQIATRSSSDVGAPVMVAGCLCGVA